MPDTRSGKSKADEREQNSELIQIITSKFNELKQDLITVRSGKSCEEAKRGI